MLAVVTAMYSELREWRAAYQAELGTLRAMLAERGSAGSKNLDRQDEGRRRQTMTSILRRQRISAHSAK